MSFITVPFVSINAWDVFDDPEYADAVAWLNQIWAVGSSDIHEFMPNDEFTRQDAAKYYSVFALSQGKQKDTTKDCKFNDLDWVDADMQEYILDACQLGLFKWSNWNFKPNDTMTKVEAITVLVRLVDGMKDETTDPWWKNYFITAQDLWITKETDVYAIDRKLTRYEIALMLYRNSDKLVSWTESWTEDVDTEDLSKMLDELIWE